MKKLIPNNSLFFSRDRLKRDLKRKSVQGAFFKVATNGASFAITMVSTIVLARLLSPEEFGLLAMVTAVTDFARSFRELGLGTSTVQREEITQDQVSMLFWINCGIGIAIMLLLICCSPVLAWFYGDTRLSYICMVLSSVFFFGGLTVQHRALLERQMRFGALGAINVVSSILCICVCIVLALREFGVWSLVFRDISYAVSYVVGTWILCRWMPSLPKRESGVKSSLRFGADISSIDIIQYFTQSLDRVLIGRFCGANSVGLYSKASQLAMMPIEQIRIIFWDVGFSPLSALQGDAERFRRFYRRLLSTMSFLYMPLVVFMMIHSENLIRLLLGDAWLNAVPLFRIFAIAAFFRPVVSTFQLVMIACGKTKRCLQWTAINGMCLILAFAIGIFWGNIGVVYGYAIASYASLLWSLVFCFKDTPVNAFFIIKNTVMPVFTSLGAGIILFFLLPAMPDRNIFISVLSSFCAFAVIYFVVLLCVPQGRQTLAEFWSYRKDLFHKSSMV